MCSCGRVLPVISQITGRTRNAFVFKDGTRAWPRVWDGRAMQALMPCQEFQVVQVDFDNVEFRYVHDNSGRPTDVEGLNAYAREHLHPSISVTPVEVTGIAALAGQKHEPFISLLAQ
jgi:phenylacetate-CoA ligase